MSMMVTSFCLVIVPILLLSLQASSARHLGIVLHNKDPAQDYKRMLLDGLSNKNDDGTKWVKDHMPSKENATILSREQQKGNSARDENNRESDHVQDYNKEQQATEAGPLEAINKDTAKPGKMVKPQVGSSSAANPAVTISWHLPHQQQQLKRKRRKKKKRGMSHDPEFTLDYAPPRVHPPCHN